MDTDLNNLVTNNNTKINGTIFFLVILIFKIIKIAVSYALIYINYFILSGLFILYFAIFASGINTLDIKLYYSIMEFLAIFFPLNLTYGVETPINIIIQMLFSISLIFTSLVIMIKFLIKKIFKVSINLSFTKELLIKFIINTIIWLVILTVSLYVNIGNGVFAIYIITSILIIISMILGKLAKVILKSTLKPIGVTMP